MDIPQIDVRCNFCRNWFRSPVGFGDPAAFDDVQMRENRAECPHCHKLTDFNKENLRMVSESGGFGGNETS